MIDKYNSCVDKYISRFHYVSNVYMLKGEISKFPLYKRVDSKFVNF